MAAVYPHLHIVLLADDYGEQLWPLARAQAPACLAPAQAGSSQSLLAAAVARTRPFSTYPLHVVTSDALASVVSVELHARCGLEPEELDVIALPFAHGSAFAIALACACIRRDDPDAVLLVVPANELVEHDERWENVIHLAFQAAGRGRIVLLGSNQPARCGAGGYVRAGKALDGLDGAYGVRAFVGDASSAAVRRAVREGALWYTGMFMARAVTLLGAYENAGEQTDAASRIGAERIAETATFFSMLEREAWRREEAAHIIAALPHACVEDVAFEQPERLASIALTSRVSMLTSLADIDETMQPDDAGNRSQANVLQVASSDVTVHAQGAQRLVCTYGLDDVFIVDADDVTLVASKRLLRDMAPVRSALAQAGAPQLEGSLTRSFAWGSAHLLSRDDHSAVWQLDVCAGALAEPLLVPAAYGIEAPGAQPGGEGADDAPQPPAARVHCAVVAGQLVVEGGTLDVAAAGDGFELHADAAASLLCEQDEPAQLLMTLVLP